MPFKGVLREGFSRAVVFIDPAVRTASVTRVEPTNESMMSEEERRGLVDHVVLQLKITKTSTHA